MFSDGGIYDEETNLYIDQIAKSMGLFLRMKSYYCHRLIYGIEFFHKGKGYIL